MVQFPDVVIIGAGAAGSGLATLLARAGLDVAVVERDARFRDRIRGETIHPWGVRHLREAGLLDDVIERAGAQRQVIWQQYRDRSPEAPHRWSDHYPDSPFGLGAGQVALQSALFDMAAEAGVAIHRPARASLERVDENVRVRVTSDEIDEVFAPRLVVGADGERSATRRWLGGTASRGTPHHVIGGVLVNGLGLESDRIHLGYFEGGFAFASPIGSDHARIYLVCDPDRGMALQRTGSLVANIVDSFSMALPEGATGADWEKAGPAGFFANPSMTVQLPRSRDVVLIGDASGRNDPSQGHGLALVARDIHLLSQMLLARDHWDDVPDRFHAEKAADFEILRQHALWSEPLATETGSDIDHIRERIARAREIDPTAGGFAGIYATGPSGLDASEASRRRFLGEDLASA